MDLIIACDANGGIGYQGRLPWPKCNSDMRHYIDITKGRIKLVTRKTLDTLPPNISCRNEYQLISRNGIDIDTAAVLFPDGIIVSGAEIYKYVIANDLINTIYLTKFQYEYPADTFIDNPDNRFYISDYQESLTTEHPHVFITFKRKDYA